MTTLTIADIAAGEAQRAPINTGFTAVETVVNGQLQNDNIAADAAIALSKLADSGVTTGDWMRFDGTDWAKFTVPMCRAHRSAAQSLTDNVLTLVQFSAADDYDIGSLHDTSTNNGRITVPAGYGGKWGFKAYAEFAQNPTGYRLIQLKHNGSISLDYSTTNAISGVTTGVSVAMDYAVAAGEYFECFVRQTSGGALNLSNAKFSAVYLGP